MSEIKLIIISNRLPINITINTNHDIIYQDSDGGLATCIKNLGIEFKWIGWTGSEIGYQYHDIINNDLKKKIFFLYI